jgi:lipopolysaccharide export system ATP-binding protein
MSQQKPRRSRKRKTTKSASPDPGASQEPSQPPDEATATTTVTEEAVESPDVTEETHPLLCVDGLTKSFSGRTVVNGVGFSVHSGEVIGLLGKNGAGKTTTFRMTIGMITPESGTIHFVGNDVTQLPMYRRARLGMGYLSQEPSVFRGLTVEQNLNAILELTPLAKRDRIRRRDELVDEFGLGRLLHSKAAVLSGGEKRRLEIARALIMDPNLILLDEPFSGVDPIAVEDIRQIILSLKERGIGILLTDHNVREALNTTDRSFIILDGRIIAQGDRDAILNDPNARKHYLGERFQM